MLELPAIVGFPLLGAITPSVLAGNLHAADVTDSFAAHGMFGDTLPAPRNLSALAGHAHATFIFVLDVVMIKNLTAVRALLECASAHPPATDGITAQDPVGDIQVVNVLLNDMIATQP